MIDVISSTNMIWMDRFLVAGRNEYRALIMVSATPGYFFQPGKNSLSLKQLAGLPKTPWRDLLITPVWPNR
jgi:hypothetical protein